MKKKLLALVCALVMIFSLASCGLSTPDTVGKVGDFEVSSGLYLLAQFSAYQQAAQLAGTDQDATDVKAFLKETITTDADSGETAVVQDYVADKTLETLRTFAAIDARFAELGGELTASVDGVLLAAEDVELMSTALMYFAKALQDGADYAVCNAVFGFGGATALYQSQPLQAQNRCAVVSRTL